MNLSKLLEKLTVRKLFQTLYGQMVVTHDVEVGALRYDSRTVERGDMFVAVRGSASDGHDYVVDAIGRGAKVVVVDDDAAVDDAFCMHNGVVKVVVPETRTALAGMSAAFHGRPGDRMTLIGVTGTNGKTTTAALIHGLLAGRAGPAGLIGTIEYRIGDRSVNATHTTPGPLELNGYLAQMVESGCTAAVMEVSSHALDQRRVEGLRFHTAVFTNLTGEHQDYHQGMEPYFAAKKMLFTGLDEDCWAVINTDDPWGRKLVAETRARVVTYGTADEAELRAEDISTTTSGTTFRMSYGGDSVNVRTALIGRFNVLNILATAGAGISLGMPLGVIADSIGTAAPVRGRFEPVPSPAGWTAIIDYAHTPDALEKTLSAIREAFGKGARIITVFGCGGDRDRRKRPAMGRLAVSLGDITVVTSDNPRTEDPEAIIDEIISGLDTDRPLYRESDRATAIRKALGMAGRGDIVLIAGKGHEEYQIIGDRRLSFSDRAVVEECIKESQ